MKRICTICARGGSKGVAGKNLKPIAGRPLLAWSVAQAKASGLFALVAFDSDSPEILEAARAAGADVLVRRPEALATDTSPKLPAIRHCLERAIAEAGFTPDVFVDLDVTSPLRSIEDIAGAVALLETSGAPNVITGTPARRSPYFNVVEERADGTVGLSKPMNPPIVRRQDAPVTYDMNASIYVWRTRAFLADPRVLYAGTRLYPMPEERSIDIDSELDFQLVEMLLTRRGSEEESPL